MSFRRLLVVVLAALSSIVCTNRADAWHHHFLGAYGASFYSPAAYVYARPTFYHGYSWGGFYRPWRPLHHWHAWRPYHTHLYVRPVVTYPVYSSFYVSPIIQYPTTYCSPIVYQQPIVYDDCLTCSVTNDNTVPSVQLPPQPDPQLQLQYTAAPRYQIAKNDQWISIAVKLIDEMAVSGGYEEAQQACEQLIRVRDQVPAEIYARCGLLALMNGQSIQDAAVHFRAMQAAQPDIEFASVLSSDFVGALKLDDYEAIKGFIQDASRQLLATKSAPKIRLTSDSSVEVTSLKPVTVEANSDAALVLDTLLRVNGKQEKADAIRSALQSLSSL